MKRSLVELLADPADGSPFRLLEGESVGDDVVSGTLASARAEYPIVEGIPRFVGSDDDGQQQTADSFGFKWTKRDSFGSDGMARELHGWLLKRYGFTSGEEMRRFFGSHNRVLDAGCGAGFAASAWLSNDWNVKTRTEWVGLDISAAIDVARERLGGFPSTHFVQADLVQPPFRAESFDVVFSEGVLHHTPSTEQAFRALVPLLTSGGELMIYVYRRKAPIREFTDDYVRDRLAELPAGEAWAALRPLTRLGQALAELETEIEVPEDVPLLGIKAGRYDVQRLLYWHVAKLFWNSDMTFEENNHLNFDWYAPRYAHRHTEDEVRSWYESAGLELTRLDVDDAGFTARGVKR
jgi:SAM-dependent methyltransferase